MRLSALLHIDVVDEDGKALGTLMDLRCRGGAMRGQPRKDAQVDTLVFGAPGFVEHIGIRRAASCEVAWDDVVRVERDRIVVRRTQNERATRSARRK